ncbi:hypothetical protein KKH24_02910, partial [Patescibacteria group bacterium]|nr:hypothetical protein [Patescibacteria group bacterium]
TIIISITTFIFAIILGFSMAERHARFSTLKQLFSSIDGLVLNSYYISGALGKKTQNQYRKILDVFLMRQFDYKVDEFDMLSDNIRGMQEFFWSVPIKNAKQGLVVDHACVGLEKIIEYERNIKYIVSNRMVGYEWGSLIILAIISLYCLLLLNDGSWSMVIFIPILGTAIVLLLFVLYMLDQLSWKHEQWMASPMFDVFEKLGLVPYIVFPMIKSGVISRKMLKGRKIRVAYFPNPYPDNSGKKIKIEQF